MLILSVQSNTPLPASPKTWTSQFTHDVGRPHTRTLDGTLEGRAGPATLHWIDPATFP